MKRASRFNETHGVKLGITKAKPSRSALWLAVVAVLTLLVSPVLAGRAHAAMMATAPPSMGMDAMAGANRVAAPCHSNGKGVCSMACALAAQLLPPATSSAEPPFTATGRAVYTHLDPSPSGSLLDRGTPPPR